MLKPTKWARSIFRPRMTAAMSSDREFPAIQRCIFGDITGWIASSIVGDATVAAGEVANLGFPSPDVRCEFMNEDDRITVATLLEI